MVRDVLVKIMAAVPKTNHAIQERVTAIMITIVPDILYAEPEVVQILHLHLMLMMIAVKYPKVHNATDGTITAVPQSLLASMEMVIVTKTVIVMDT